MPFHVQTMATLALRIQFSKWCIPFRDVLQGKSWSRAFSELGLRGSQDAVSAAVRSAAGFIAAPAVPVTRPMGPGLTCVFPRRFRVPCGLLWHAARSPAVAAVAPTSPPRPPPASPPPTVERDDARPWFGRARSTSTMDLRSAAASFEPANSSSGPARPRAIPIAPAPWTEPPLPPPTESSAPRGETPSESESAAAGSTAVDAKASLLGALSQLAPSLGGKIASMKKEVRRGKAEEKRLAKELRNAEKRKKRLCALHGAPGRRPFACVGHAPGQGCGGGDHRIAGVVLQATAAAVVPALL